MCTNEQRVLGETGTFCFSISSLTARHSRPAGLSVSVRRTQSYDLLDESTLAQVPLGRKFRSLKIWLTMRAFGLDKVRGLVRSQTELAKDFEAMVETDER